MKVNKKYKALLAIGALAAFIMLPGCSAKETEVEPPVNPGEDRLQIVTTIYPQYDFAKNIGKSLVDVTMLLPLGTESHSYEPSPKDIITIQNSDLFIYTGGVEDYWVEQVIASMGDQAPKTLAMMDSIKPLEEEHIDGMAEEGHEDEHEELDEHVWTSPKNAMAIVQQISDKMAIMDPENSQEYIENRDSYIKELEKLDQELENIVATGKRKTILVGDRFPFRYLTHDYQIKYYAAFEGCSTETEPSAANIAFLMDKVKTEKIPVVFHLEFSDGKVAEAIIKGSEAKTALLHSAHNITKEDFENNLGYIEIMNKNISALKEALN